MHNTNGTVVTHESDVPATAFLLYMLVAVKLTINIVLRLCKGKNHSRFVICSRVGILVLTVGTALDNARHFWGSFPELDPSFTLNQIVTWLCIFTHRVLSAWSIFVPFQLCAAVSNSSRVRKGLFWAATILVAVGLLVGTIDFLASGSFVLETEYTCSEIGALALLTWKTSSEISLLNVLAYTIFTVAAGIYICYTKEIRDRASIWWVVFLVANILCLVGQSLQSNLGPTYHCYGPNFWEQITFATVVVSDRILNEPREEQIENQKTTRCIKQKVARNALEAFFLGIDSPWAREHPRINDERCCRPKSCVCSRKALLVSFGVYFGMGSFFVSKEGVTAFVGVFGENGDIARTNDHLLCYLAIPMTLLLLSKFWKKFCFVLPNRELKRMENLRRPYFWVFTPPKSVLSLTVIIITMQIVTYLLKGFYWNTLMSAVGSSAVGFSLGLGALRTFWLAAKYVAKDQDGLLLDDHNLVLVQSDLQTM